MRDRGPPSLGHLPPAQSREFVRLDGELAAPDTAAIAEEVPVAFVYGGKPHVVMMCTPADLEDLAVGFTLSEEIVARASDVARVDVVRHARGIEVQMELPPEAQARVAERTRALAGRTGCGLCGIEAIDAALRAPRRVSSAVTFTREALTRAGEALAGRQELNNATRAVHAAAFADASGRLLVVREDVGRHNALDKVIGALARGVAPGSASTAETSAAPASAAPASAAPASAAPASAAPRGTPQLDPAGGFFVVTSRASYELVQKVAVAGAPLLAAVSRPTGLAIRFADEAGVTLVGLLRGASANVYTHPGRIVS